MVGLDAEFYALSTDSRFKGGSGTKTGVLTEKPDRIPVFHSNPCRCLRVFVWR